MCLYNATNQCTLYKGGLTMKKFENHWLRNCKQHIRCDVTVKPSIWLTKNVLLLYIYHFSFIDPLKAPCPISLSRGWCLNHQNTPLPHLWFSSAFGSANVRPVMSDCLKRNSQNDYPNRFYTSTLYFILHFILYCCKKFIFRQLCKNSKIVQF